jgi:hypothetical protein
MAAPEVPLTDPQRYEVNTVVDVLEGDDRVVVLLPTAVPAGKKAQVRLEVRARLIDA